MADIRVNGLPLREQCDYENDRLLIDTMTGTMAVSPDVLLDEVTRKIENLIHQVNALKLHVAEPGTLIINQYYGGDGGSVSQQFVELYNCTDEDIVLNGKSLQYIPPAGDAVVLALKGTIPARCSFLIKAANGNAKTTVTYLDLSTKAFDQDWSTQAFKNKGVGFILMEGTTPVTDFSDVTKLTGFIDAMSSSADGSDFPQFKVGTGCANDQSKQKAIRKHILAKSVDNSLDASIVDYRKDYNMDKAPKCVADGPWR